MRLNGLGAPDEMTIVASNIVETAHPQTEIKSTENRTRENKKGYCL